MVNNGHPGEKHTLARLDKHWQVAPRAPADHFERFPDLSPLIVQILYNRQIQEEQAVRDFMAYRWTDDDPGRLKGMPQAVERLSQAILRREPIAVYGDYDADGVTATVLLVQLLAALGATVQSYIPNRFDEGYGVHKEALTELAGQGIRVVLTVDCGIRAIAEAEHANRLGLDMIITDHHHVGEKVPAALAAINPRQPGCAYPFKDLAGVGLAFKLGQALLRCETLQGCYNPARLNEDTFLDLVALGTVADLAPLAGENRRLVARGLERINRSLRPGLAALMGKMGSRPAVVSSGTIGFFLGPRLNAAGRLDSALAAYNLLMADNELMAIPLAAQLDQQNQERQRLTREMVDAAREVILADATQESLHFISHPDFNPGVVGLAASRLVEEFYRPVLVAQQGPEETRGSARSISEFHITQALDACADLLVRYGGHAAAAGFTVKNENLPAFQERLRQVAGQRLDTAGLQPTLKIDADIKLRAVGHSLIEEISALQPFGYGNPTPCFLTRGLTVKQCKTIGADNQHLRLVLHDGRQNRNAIAFRQGYRAETLQLGQQVDVVYHLEFNEWNGERWPQLEIKDLRPSAGDE